ncbi:MAG: hypothetical protein JW803_02300, partial [Endomicrobiales bacterium]|nr:hypothetical protein [Endomicrobiales bacterium]
ECSGQGRCVISGNKLKGCDIELMDQSSGMIEKNLIAGETGVNGSVVVRDSSIAQIKENRIDLGNRGIECNGQSRCVITNNEIRLRKLNACDKADKRTISSNGMCISTGIVVSNQASADIKRNRIESMDNDSEVGILLTDLSNSDISENKIKVSSAISAFESAQVRISSNNITADTAISLNQICVANISGNAVSVTNAAVVCNDRAAADIAGNKISGAKEYTVGIMVQESAECRLENNKLSNIREKIILNDTGKMSIIDKNINGEYAAARRAHERGSRYERIKYVIREGVVKLGKYRIANTIFKIYYYLAIFCAKVVLARLKRVKAVYLRRGMATNKDWIPGISDIDIMIVIDNMAPKDENIFLKRLTSFCGALKSVFPVLGEMQVMNFRECGNYFSGGDIRTCKKIDSWLLVAGKDVCREERSLTKESFIVGTLTELMEAYMKINQIYFYGKKDILGVMTYTKHFADLLKYSATIKKGEYCPYRSRGDVLRECADRSADSAEKEIYLRALSVWEKRTGAGDSYYNDIFILSVSKTNEILRGYFDTVAANVNSYKHFETPETLLNKADKLQYKMFSMLVNEIKAMLGSCFLGMICDNPGHIFVLVAEEYVNKEKMKDDMLQELSAIIRTKNRYSNTPLVIVTKNIYQALIYSLYNEMPFTYYKLIKNGNGADMEIKDTGSEKREQYGFLDALYKHPGDDILDVMIKQMVSRFAISIRMCAIDNNGDYKYRSAYLLSRILGLRMAYEKKMIVDPYLDTVLFNYTQCYPEHRAQIDALKMKLDIAKNSVAMDTYRQGIEEYLPVLRDAIDNMSMRIEESQGGGNGPY